MMKRCSLATIRSVWALLALLVAGIGSASRADTHSYASQPRQIKAGILVTNAAPGIVGTGPENAVPYVFYIMDRRADLKPAGWSFINPLAPPTLTGDIVQRWKNRDGNNLDTSLNDPQFKVGAQVNKNIGAYWEVNLDSVSADDLHQFNLLLMAYHNGHVQFTDTEREKLRQFVDGGGTIWLEDEGGMDFTGPNGHAAAQFIIDLGFVQALPAVQLPSLASMHHPLVNYPFTISPLDVQSLGISGAVNRHIHQNVAPNGTVGGLANPRVLVPVVWVGLPAVQMPYVSAGDYGAGHIIVSSAGIATGISSFVGGVNIGEGGNSGAISGEGTLAVRPVDLEFAYNLVAWTSSVPSQGVSSRRLGGTQEQIGSQLGQRWQTIVAPGGPAVGGSGAVIHKGVVFYVDGNNVLHAYDASPQQDLDNDGNPDDGIPDYILGAPYDEIWNVNLVGVAGTAAGTRVSTPMVFSYVDNTGTPRDAVCVSTSTGATIAYNAFPQGANGKLQPSPGAPLWIVSDTAGDLSGDLFDHNMNPLPAPGAAYSDGVLFTFVADAGTDVNHPWHIFPVDPLTGTNIFNGNALGMAPSTQNVGGGVPGIPNIVGSLTAGYVRDETTGALDRVVYSPTRTPSTMDIGASTVHGVWFSTRGEPLNPTDVITAMNPGHLTYRATGERARVPWYVTAPAGNSPDLRPVIYAISNTGVKTRLVYNVDFTITYEGTIPNREVDVHIQNPGQGFDDTFSLFADYTLDWPGDSLPDAMGNPVQPQGPEMARFTRRLFGMFNPNPNQAPAMHITGAPVLSPEGLLLMGGGDYPAGDRIYGVHEQYNVGAAVAGRQRLNQTAVAWMFSPNGPNTEAIELLGTAGLPPRLVNNDTFLSPTTNPGATPPNVVATDLEIVGSPAYSNGTAYVVGFCHMLVPGAAAPLFNATIILALSANPDTTFTARQADGTLIPFPNDGTQVTLQQPDLVNSTVANPRYITLRENLNFTVDRDSSTIHIFDMRAAGQDSFNTALPILVSVGNTQVNIPVVNTQTGYGPLDNLLWWMIIPQTPNVPGALPAVQMPAALIDPVIGGSSINPASGPTVFGDTLYFGTQTGRIAALDMHTISANGGQAHIYDSDGSLRITAQTALTDTTGKPVVMPIINPPLGTTGIVAIGTPAGLAALDNQSTLIADNDRLIEVDHAGRAVWTLDGTQTTGVVGGPIPGNGNIAAVKISLSRPSVAHRYTLNSFLVCDTGNNRVIQVDKGGIVTWELHGLNNDMRFLRAGDPTTLNQPTDVQTYTQLVTGLAFTSPVTGATYTPSGNSPGPYSTVHYIVADSGNYRAVEVLDAYDQNGRPVVMNGSDGSTAILQRQVVFVTRSLAEQNRHFRYRTIQQFLDQNGNTFMVAAVDNVTQPVLNPNLAVGSSASATEGPGGSLMVIPRMPGNANDGLNPAIINSIAIVDKANNIVRHQQISNPTWFKEFNLPDPANPGQAKLHYLLADANGCYQLAPSANGKEALVEWMLTAEDYYHMTGRRLRASSIQRLGAADFDPVTNRFFPHYLITNGYTGSDNVFEVFGNPQNVIDGDSHGEVFEVRSFDYYTNTDANNVYNGYTNPPAGRNPNLYFTGVLPCGMGTVNALQSNPKSAIVWLTPTETIPLDCNNGVVTPHPIKRSIGNALSPGTSTSLYEHPAFSDRPY